MAEDQAEISSAPVPVPDKKDSRAVQFKNFLSGFKERFKRVEKSSVPEGSAYQSIINNLRQQGREDWAVSMEKSHKRMLDLINKMDYSIVGSHKAEIIKEINSGNLGMIYAVLERVFASAPQPGFGERTRVDQDRIVIETEANNAREVVVSLVTNSLIGRSNTEAGRSLFRKLRKPFEEDNAKRTFGSLISLLPPKPAQERKSLIRRVASVLPSGANGLQPSPVPVEIRTR